MKKMNNSKINIMKYTYGHGVPTVCHDFPPPEVIKSWSQKKVFYCSSYKPSMIDKIKSSYFRLLRKIKNFPFKILILFKNKVLIAKDVLSDLELRSHVKFSDHYWVDVMGGTGAWTEALEQLSLKKAFNIDIMADDELKDNGMKIYSSNRINRNILDLKLDPSINAVFIRSGLKDGILEDFLRNNSNVKILVYCQIKYSSNGSKGIGHLFKNNEKVSIKRCRSFELDSISNLKFNSENYSYDFHVFTR